MPTAPSATAGPGAPAVVLYDADCGFCRWSVAQLLRLDARLRLRPVAIQAPEGQELLADLPAAQRLDSAHTIAADGRRHSGGAWLAAALDELPRGRGPASGLRALRGPVELGYAIIARNRPLVSRLVPAPGKRGAQARIDLHAARFPDPAAPPAARAHAAAG